MSEKSPKIKIKTEYIIIIALAVAVGISVITSFNKKTVSTESDVSETEQYVSALESKMQTIISGIKGAGKTTVVITVDGGIGSIVAKDEKTVDENGRKVTTTTVVLSGGKPVILGKQYPEISGVLVACKGADDITVKMAILNAVTTALNVSCNKVQILAR